MNLLQRAQDWVLLNEQAQLLRKGSQLAGISRPEDWDKLSDHRKIRWILLASGIAESGNVVVSIDFLQRMRKAMREDADDWRKLEEVTDVLDKILGTEAGGDDAGPEDDGISNKATPGSE